MVKLAAAPWYDQHMKLYVNRQPVFGPWGGGNAFVTACHRLMPKLAGTEFLINHDGSINPDVILLAGLENDGADISAEQALMYKLYAKPDCKVVLRVNENDARKGTRHMDELLLKLSHHVDGTVFVSRWLQGYFNDKGWGCKHQAVIINGVDQQVFRPQPKLSNGKLNVVAHHWSDNPMKGADTYERIDQLVGEHPDKLAFTYVGRHRCAFKHTTVVGPLHGKALGEELGKHDAYVSASLFDPGPNHVIEALACGLPTWVHEDGGGCVEFAGSDHAYRGWDELRAVLVDRVGNTQAALHPNSSFVPGTWQQCIEEYNGFLRATWQGSTPGSHSS